MTGPGFIVCICSQPGWGQWRGAPWSQKQSFLRHSLLPGVSNMRAGGMRAVLCRRRGQDTGQPADRGCGEGGGEGVRCIISDTSIQASPYAASVPLPTKYRQYSAAPNPPLSQSMISQASLYPDYNSACLSIIYSYGTCNGLARCTLRRWRYRAALPGRAFDPRSQPEAQACFLRPQGRCPG